MKNRSVFTASPIVALTAWSSAWAIVTPDNADPHAEGELGQTIHCDVPVGEGVINALDVKQSSVNISHKPRHSIGFKEMAMDFPVLKPVDLSEFSIGERVHFLLKPEQGKSDSIAAMCSLDINEEAHKACMAKLHEEAMKLAAAAIDQCAMNDMEPSNDVDHDHVDEVDDADEHERAGHH